MISKKEQDKRKPQFKPEELVDAMQVRVHYPIGKSRPVKTHRVRCIFCYNDRLVSIIMEPKEEYENKNKITSIPELEAEEERKED